MVKKYQSKEEEEKAKLEAKREALKKAKSKGFFSQFTIPIVNPAKYSKKMRDFLRDWLGIESNETNNVILKQILGTLERIEKIKNEEEVDGIDLGFINPEDMASHNERVNNFQTNVDHNSSYVKLPADGSGGNVQNRKRGGLAAQSVASNNYYGNTKEEKIYQKNRNELINPAWIEHPLLLESEVDFLDPKETVPF